MVNKDVKKGEVGVCENKMTQRSECQNMSRAGEGLQIYEGGEVQIASLFQVSRKAPGIRALKGILSLEPAHSQMNCYCLERVMREATLSLRDCVVTQTKGEDAGYHRESMSWVGHLVLESPVRHRRVLASGEHMFYGLQIAQC